jgi:hypothetical protein
MRRRKPVSESVKAAADAAERRSKGVPLDDPPSAAGETPPAEVKAPTVYPIKSAGRPSEYKTEYAAIARAMCKLGATDADLAEAFGVSTWTIWHWQSRHEAFSKAVKVAKGAYDDRIERALAARAQGYSYNAVKINVHEGVPVVTEYLEHVPPDVGAIKLWLTNRRPEKWREKVDVDHSGIVQVREVRRVIVRAAAPPAR